MRKYNESTVKIKMVKIGLVSRILILVAAFLLYKYGGFLTSTFTEFLYILLPVSCLYITLFIKFIIKNAYQYQDQGRPIKPEYISLGYYGLLALNVVEFMVILYKAFNFNPQMPVGDFFLYLVGVEMLFGIFAGFYISDLFHTKKPGQ